MENRNQKLGGEELFMFGLKTLLGCPFCGGNAIILREDHPIVKMFEYDYWRVVCNNCSCSTPVCERRDEAISLWNKRIQTKNKGEVMKSIFISNNYYYCKKCIYRWKIPILHSNFCWMFRTDPWLRAGCCLEKKEKETPLSLWK